MISLVDVLGYIPDLISRGIRYFVERPDMTIEPPHIGGYYEDFVNDEKNVYEVTDVFITVQVSNGGGGTSLRKAILTAKRSKGEQLKDIKFLEGIAVPPHSARNLRFRFSLGDHLGGVSVPCELALVDTGNRSHRCKLLITPRMPPQEWDGYL